jgi:hypothetical protein
MTVRRTLSVVTTCLVVLVGAACSDRGGAPLPAETDEPFYVQGKQLMRQGRNPEALTSFLKVIDRRGERGAAESHLEAGLIYLTHTKDPVEAYHHFRKYLDLQPNSKEAVRVRGMVEAAKREFARTLPARPLDDQSLKMQADDALEKTAPRERGTARADRDASRDQCSPDRAGGADDQPPRRRTAAFTTTAGYVRGEYRQRKHWQFTRGRHAYDAPSKRCVSNATGGAARISALDCADASRDARRPHAHGDGQRDALRHFGEVLRERPAG